MELDLQQYNLTRPHKVEWYVSPMPADPLDIIKSKSTKKFLKNNNDDFLRDAHLTVDTHQVNEEEFVGWLSFYEEKMKENDFQVLATPQWYKDRMSEGCTIYGIFVNSPEKLVGAGMITATPEGKFSLSFKASDRLELSQYQNSSLGTVIEYISLKFCYEKKATAITSGKSRNAFGFTNKLGYLNFKTRFGYSPVVVQGEPQYHTVECLDDQPVCFYAYKTPDQKLDLYVYNHKQPLSESLKGVLAYTDYQVLE